MVDVRDKLSRRGGDERLLICTALRKFIFIISAEPAKTWPLSATQPTVTSQGFTSCGPETILGASQASCLPTGMTIT